MRGKPVDHIEGEASMTDFQFKAYIELRDKYDALVQENNLLRQKEIAGDQDGMTDYQFRRYEKLREKFEEMSHELSLLREENIKLQIQTEMLKALTADRK